MSVCKHTGDPKRSCKCKPCVGRRSRTMGQRRQREARKALIAAGLINEDLQPIRTGNEETWTGRVRAEVKAGLQVKAIHTKYAAAATQDAVSGLVPFMLVTLQPGSKQILVTMTLDDAIRLREMP